MTSSDSIQCQRSIQPTFKYIFPVECLDVSKKSKGNGNMTNDDGRFLMLSAFAADCLGILPEELDELLIEMAQEHVKTNDWRSLVTVQFGCTKESLLERFHELLRLEAPASTALVLMLTQAGCKEPRNFLAPVFGDATKLDSLIA